IYDGARAAVLNTRCPVEAGMLVYKPNHSCADGSPQSNVKSPCFRFLNTSEVRLLFPQELTVTSLTPLTMLTMLHTYQKTTHTHTHSHTLLTMLHTHQKTAHTHTLTHTANYAPH